MEGDGCGVEQLYLVELVVGDLRGDPDRPCTLGPHRVQLKFLHFEPIEVLEEEPSQDEQEEEKPEENEQKRCKFSTGKSCMFPMEPEQLIMQMSRTPMSVCVYGKECEASPPSLVGHAKFFLTDAFMEAVSLATTPVVLPVTAYLEQTFTLRDVFGDAAGEIDLCLRLSCYGEAMSAAEGKSDPRCLVKESKGERGQRPCQGAVPVSAKEPETEPEPEPHRPLVTCMETVMPATTERPCPSPFKRSVPWRRTKDELPPAPPVRPSVCTCPCVPPLLVPAPSAPTCSPLRCECADILASLRAPPGPPCPQPPPTPPPVSPPADPAPPTEQVQPPSFHVPPPPPPTEPLPTPSAPEPIVPASQICGLELKNKVSRSVSEEKVTTKLDLKKSASAAEVSPPPGEESAKKVLEQEVNNWENRKKNIQDEFKKKKTKTKNAYEYTAGMYPGMVIGHRYCIPGIRFVPRNMGWLWTLLEWKGWRPGAIKKTVTGNFGNWKKAAGLHEEDEEGGDGPRRRKRAVGSKPATADRRIVQPSLHVHKKDGFYYVTMHPTGEDIPPDAKPISFKVDPRKASSDEETSSYQTTEDSFEFEYVTPGALAPPKRKVEKTIGWSQYNEADFLPKRKLAEQQEEQKKEEPKPEVKATAAAAAAAGKEKGKKNKKK